MNIYSNTSHVTINQGGFDLGETLVQDSNTSHVTINQF